MSKQKKKTLVAVVVLVVVIILALAAWLIFKPGTTEGSKSLDVQVIHGDGTVAEFNIKTDEEYLRGALDQENLIDGTESEYGLYVLTVDGETVDESNQEWWYFTQDGEMLMTGVDSTPIADGEHYEITFTVGW